MGQHILLTRIAWDGEHIVEECYLILRDDRGPGDRKVWNQICIYLSHQHILHHIKHSFKLFLRNHQGRQQADDVWTGWEGEDTTFKQCLEVWLRPSAEFDAEQQSSTAHLANERCRQCAESFQGLCAKHSSTLW